MQEAVFTGYPGSVRDARDQNGRNVNKILRHELVCELRMIDLLPRRHWETPSGRNYMLCWTEPGSFGADGLNMQNI